MIIQILLFKCSKNISIASADTKVVLSNLVDGLNNAKLKGSVKTCLFFNECNRTEIHDGNKWKENWYGYQDGWICDIHYHRLVRNPKRSKEYIKKYNDRRPKGFWKKYRRTREESKKWNRKYNQRKISFKRKPIVLTFIPKTGYCSWCSNNIYDGSCKITNMHHIQYYIIFPWFATVELCMSCHSNETWRQIRQNIMSLK